MPRFVFDTDHLTLFHHGHASLGARMVVQPPGAVALSIITVEEAVRGRLAALSQARTRPQRLTRYAQFEETVKLVGQFPIVGYDQAAESQFQQFQALRLRIGTQDLKMAAVALANALIVLTCNRRDFGRLPGLMLDDWSV